MKVWIDTQLAMKRFFNKNCMEHTFKASDLIMLSSKNITLKKPSHKLSDRFLGPFEVL